MTNQQYHLQCIRHLVIEGIKPTFEWSDSFGKVYYYEIAHTVYRIEEFPDWLSDAHIVPWLGY